MTGRLVVLTDRSMLPAGRDLIATLRECAAAGLEAVIVREHDLPGAERHRLFGTLREVEGLQVISSRIPDPSAHGLHLAAGQPLSPLTGVVSRSCHHVGEVAAAEREGLVWVTLSPYALTESKPGYGPPLAATAYAGHGLPVLALGGITPANAAQARARGAHGVAVMGAVMRANDPAGVVADLLEAVA